jgi:hypothetical protein
VGREEDKMSTLDDTRLLTIGQVARFVHLRKSYVKAAVRGGELPYHTVDDGRRLWRPQDVRDWVAARAAELPTYASRRQPPTPPPRTEVRRNDPTPPAARAQHPSEPEVPQRVGPIYVGRAATPLYPVAVAPAQAAPGGGGHGGATRDFDLAKAFRLFTSETGVPIASRDEIYSNRLPRILSRGPLEMQVWRMRPDGGWTDSGHRVVDISEVMQPGRVLRYGGMYQIAIYPECDDSDRCAFPFEIPFEIQGNDPPPGWSFGNDTSQTPLD